MTATRWSSSSRPMDGPRDVVVAFVAAVNEQDWSVVEALVAPGFVRHSDAAGTSTASMS